MYVYVMIFFQFVFKYYQFDNKLIVFILSYYNLTLVVQFGF